MRARAGGPTYRFGRRTRADLEAHPGVLRRLDHTGAAQPGHVACTVHPEEERVGEPREDLRRPLCVLVDQAWGWSDIVGSRAWMEQGGANHRSVRARVQECDVRAVELLRSDASCVRAVKVHGLISI